MSLDLKLLSGEATWGQPVLWCRLPAGFPQLTSATGRGIAAHGT